MQHFLLPHAARGGFAGIRTREKGSDEQSREKRSSLPGRDSGNFVLVQTLPYVARANGLQIAEEEGESMWQRIRKEKAAGRKTQTLN